ncbi:MAG: 5-formyltetrahydrofolate cyclo-ligase [Agathobacter sp.]|nr:5-formyltetrahydrofolate cyclo-ligase [Agathobacter sp.]
MEIIAKICIIKCMKPKKELRTQILQIRDALTEEQRHNYSAEITKTVLASEEYQNAETLLIYASFKSEVNTFPLIEQAFKDRKKIYVPKIEEAVQNDGTQTKRMEFYEIFSTDEFQDGYRGIPEPKAEIKRRFSISGRGEHSLSEDKILVLLPGAVFDLEGNRIGYGGGFYDRYLHDLEWLLENLQEQSCKAQEMPIVTMYKMALAFECQVVEQGMIPVEEHDVQVDVIVTEQGIYETILYG